MPRSVPFLLKLSKILSKILWLVAFIGHVPIANALAIKLAVRAKSGPNGRKRQQHIVPAWKARGGVAHAVHELEHGGFVMSLRIVIKPFPGTLPGAASYGFAACSRVANNV